MKSLDRRKFIALSAASGAAIIMTRSGKAVAGRAFELEEKTVAELRQEMERGELSAYMVSATLGAAVGVTPAPRAARAVLIQTHLPGTKSSVLDKTTEAQVLDLVQALRARLGAALIYVSHDLHVISAMCERVLVMLRGASSRVRAARRAVAAVTALSLVVNSTMPARGCPSRVAKTTCVGSASSTRTWKFDRPCSFTVLKNDMSVCQNDGP